MALQGTLETFTVPDVLRLLATTKKTGRFSLEGDRGTGQVWLADGQLTAATSDREHGTDADSVLFDLLRYKTGAFTFEPDAEIPDALVDQVSDGDVESALGRAEELLEEWREIETVIPSLDTWVRLVDQVESDVTISVDLWPALAVLGGGSTGRRVGGDLDLGELDACRRLRQLVDLGVAEVDTEFVSAGERMGLSSIVPSDVPPPPPPPPPPVDDPVMVDHDLSSDEVADLGADLAGFVARPTPAEEDDADPTAHDTLDAPQELDPAAAVAAEWDAMAETSFDDADPADHADHADHADGGVAADGDEFLSQLANLSPKAARAIEAIDGDDAEQPTLSAAAGLLDGDVDAEAGDEELNKNLLLKFLSSAKN